MDRVFIKLFKAIAMALLMATTTLLVAQSPTPAVNAVFRDGFAAYQEGNYQLALTNYNNAINMAPDKAYLYYNRGITYRAMNNAAMAIADLQKSIDLRPTAEAYSQLGAIKYEKGDNAGAKADFENARTLNQDMGKMNFCLGMIYYRGEQYEDALKCLTDYTATIKNQPDAFYYKGMSEAKLGRYSEAIVSFKEALQYKDHDWMLYYKMYDFYLAVNDTANALNSITMVIEIGTKKPEFYEKRAALYKAMGNDFKYNEDMDEIKKLQTQTTGTASN